MLLFLLLITLLSTWIRCGIWSQRIWIVNTNVTVGSRYWDSLVTIGSHTFNGSMTHAVAIPRVNGDADECELIYPLDKLPASISRDLYNTTEERKCVDEELANKMDRIFWLDPRNWETDFNAVSLFQFSKAVPHIERIPCDYDRVVIPNKTSTFIILPPNPIKLRTLRWGEQLILSHNKEKYFENEYFTRHFIMKSSMNLSDILNVTSFSTCKEMNGCQCGMKIYEKEICAFVADDCAKNLPCEEPFKPQGHCCSICGATVVVYFDRKTFVYNKLEPVVEKFIQSQSEKMKYEVNAYMSKVSVYSVQVVLLPKHEYSDELLDLANGLKTYLEKASNLGIRRCWNLNGGKRKGGQQDWSSILVIFVGLAIALIVGILLVYANRLTWFQGVKSLFEGLRSTKLTEDENQQNKSTVSKEVEEEENNTQTEEVAENASLPVVQPEEQADLIDTGDKLI